jgi:hypothetical protein
VEHPVNSVKPYGEATEMKVKIKNIKNSNLIENSERQNNGSKASPPPSYYLFSKSNILITTNCVLLWNKSISTATFRELHFQ